MNIGIEDFKKIEIKVGEIVSAEKIENSEKLLKLSVNFGEENNRQVISGISKYFEDPELLVGTKCAFTTNLEPRMIMGLESQAMILAVSGEDFFSLLKVDRSAPPGSAVK